MKILFVNNTALQTGAPISCTLIMTGLGEGFVSVFASFEEGPLFEKLRLRGITSYVVPEKGFLGLKFIVEFMRIIKREKVDLVHLNTLTPFCKYAGIAARLLGVPVIWFVRENPLISRSKRLRFWLTKLASRIVFVDRDTRDKLLPGGAAEVIYNGVDLEAFRPFRQTSSFRSSLGLGNADILIGYTGLITERKGVLTLIEAFALLKKRYKNTKLAIIGGSKKNDSAYAEIVQRAVISLGLQHDILFPGLMTDIRPALSGIDIGVLLSKEERCSRSLLEYIACGIPVVATRVGGTPEIIKDGINGLLVEPENAAQAAEALMKLVEDTGLRRRMGASGREIAVASFDIQKNLALLRRLYTETAGK